MADTFIKIASVTVGSGGASSIDFTSIPSTYTDLQLVCSVRSANAGATPSLKLRANGSTSSYTDKYLTGDGGSAVSGSPTYGYVLSTSGAAATSNTFGNHSIYIPNYAGSNYKSISADGVAENNSSTIYVLGLSAVLWSNTAAINQLTLLDRAGSNLAQYSTAVLYGIKNS